MIRTQIILEHPGYFWEWDEESQRWNMMWEPVHQWYSPPRLHPQIMKQEVSVPDSLMHKIGLLIGRQGYNFIRITEQTGCDYIFYLSMTNKIEVWGKHETVIRAVRKLENLMNNLQQ